MRTIDHVLQAVDEELARDQQTIDQFIMVVQPALLALRTVGNWP